ncbi:MAG: hypothetical protein MZV63_18040 [Marinilabiliales bacterium]|nr:hypothetical protein [Marinilabiliales bacterium]
MRVHLGPGRRGDPGRQDRVRLQRPATAPLPPGGRQGRHGRVLQRARGARAGADRRGGRRAAGQRAPRRDRPKRRGGRHRHRLRRAGGRRWSWTARSPRVIRTQNAVRAARDTAALPAGRAAGGRRRRARFAAPVEPVPAYDDAAGHRACRTGRRSGEINDHAGHLHRAHQDRRRRATSRAWTSRADWGKRHLGLQFDLVDRHGRGTSACMPPCRSSTAGGRRARSPRPRATLASITINELKLRDGHHARGADRRRQRRRRRWRS